MMMLTEYFIELQSESIHSAFCTDTAVNYMYVCLCYYNSLCSDVISLQLEQYASMLQRRGSLHGNVVIPARLHCLLGNLLAQSLHHRDIVHSESAAQFLTGQYV